MSNTPINEIMKGNITFRSTCVSDLPTNLNPTKKEISKPIEIIIKLLLFLLNHSSKLSLISFSQHMRRGALLKSFPLNFQEKIK